MISKLQKTIVLILIILIPALTFFVSPVKASEGDTCSSALGLTVQTSPNSPMPEGTTSVNVTLTATKGTLNGYYQIGIQRLIGLIRTYPDSIVHATGNTSITITLDNRFGDLITGTTTAVIEQSTSSSINASNRNDICSFGITIGIPPSNGSQCRMAYYPQDPTTAEPIGVYITGGIPGDWVVYSQNGGLLTKHTINRGTIHLDSSGNGNTVIDPISDVGLGNLVLGPSTGLSTTLYCSTPINITPDIGNPPRSTTGPGPGSGSTGTTRSGVATGGAGNNCNPPKANSVDTALGCLTYDPATFVSTILKWVLGFAGGIALLLMILGAFKMVTSSGNPDALKSGQEQFTSAIIGLIFIIFSVTLLQIIGIDILQIPGLGR